MVQNIYAKLKYLVIVFLILAPILLGITTIQRMIPNSLSEGDIIFINVIRLCSIVFGIIVLFYDRLNTMFINMLKKYKIDNTETKILLALLFIIIFLGSLYLVAVGSNAKVFMFQFNMDAEHNFMTWFSSSLLLSVGVLAFMVVTLNKQIDKKYFWSMFSAIFIFLSLDDTISIHESLIRRFHVDSWFFVGAPAAMVVFGILLYAAIKSEIDSEVWKNLFLGISIILIGAVGFEIIGKYLLVYNSTPYFIEVFIEECLENIGPAVIIYTLLKILRKNVKQSNL